MTANAPAALPAAGAFCVQAVHAGLHAPSWAVGMLSRRVAGELCIKVPPMGGASGNWGECLHLHAAGARALQVDLSAVKFVEPPFLVRLRALLEWYAEQGAQVVVQPPAVHDVHMYLSRMGVADDLPAGCQCPTLDHYPHDRGDVLIPVRRLDLPTDSDRLDDDVGTLLAAHFDGPLARIAAAFGKAVSEMTDNATTHGRSQVGAYVAAQRYRQGARTRCVLAIGDCGVGIPQHIRQVEPDLSDDGEAIARAAEPSVTAAHDRETRHRGYGYPHMVEEMVLSGTESELTVWSGAGVFRIVIRDGREWARLTHTASTKTVGTWVKVVLWS